MGKEKERFKNMKVLFVASIYRHLTAFHIPYIEYFQSKGYEVWASGMGKEDRMILEEYGVSCIDIPFSRSPLNSGNINAYKTLKKLFRTEQFELVHVHTPVAALLTRAAFRSSKQGKIIYTAHGFHFFEGAPKQNWLIYYSVEKLAARWTDHLITINEEDYQNAHKLLPVNKISYVHGVGVELVSVSLKLEEKISLRQELGLRDYSVVIACIAELNNNKNHQFLLRNWSVLKELCPDLELLLIGTGEKEVELKEFVKIERLSDVHFLGFRRDVPNLLKISDIVTLLSHREGLPKSIMEAMAEGIPCVVTNTRGLRDLVRSNENGFVINHNDDKYLIEAFSKLSKLPGLRKEMGQRATELIKPYLIDNVLPEYKEIYDEILK